LTSLFLFPGQVLGGVGDAIGFRNGKWEFLKDGPRIHAQLGELGGISALTYAASPPVSRP
jgi:hypothetical protein